MFLSIAASDGARSLSCDGRLVRDCRKPAVFRLLDTLSPAKRIQLHQESSRCLWGIAWCTIRKKEREGLPSLGCILQSHSPF